MSQSLKDELFQTKDKSVGRTSEASYPRIFVMALRAMKVAGYLTLGVGIATLGFGVATAATLIAAVRNELKIESAWDLRRGCAKWVVGISNEDRELVYDCLVRKTLSRDQKTRCDLRLCLVV